MRQAQRLSDKIVQQRTQPPPLIVAFIDSLYSQLEQTLHPRKETILRDFCYSVYDPRHWGRPLPGQIERFSGSSHGIYKARVRFDFEAAAHGELSIKENELVYILGNLGNGWLTARRHPNSNNDGNNGEDAAKDGEKGQTGDLYGNHALNLPPPTPSSTGLVPENYVQRL